MSLIWDIVQSVERRAAMPLRQHRAGISSHRQLTFSDGCEMSQQEKQQQRSTSASDVADTRVSADVDTAASASDITHPQNTESEEQKQKTAGLQELEGGTGGSDGLQELGGTGGSEQLAMQQQSAAIHIDQHTTNEQVSSKLSTRGKQSDEMNSNTKQSVKTQQVIASENTMTSSGSRVENTSASSNTHESMVPGCGTTPNTEDVADHSG